MSVDLRQHESKPNTDTQFSSVWFSLAKLSRTTKFMLLYHADAVRCEMDVFNTLTLTPFHSIFSSLTSFELKDHRLYKWCIS